MSAFISEHVFWISGRPSLAVEDWLTQFAMEKLPTLTQMCCDFYDNCTSDEEIVIAKECGFCDPDTPLPEHCPIPEKILKDLKRLSAFLVAVLTDEDWQQYSVEPKYVFAR